MRIEHRGGVKFSAQVRGHEIVSDLPGPRGTDAGMTPPEWLLASLGSCVGVYVAEFCANHNVPYEGFAVEIDAQKTEDPSRFGAIQCKIHMPDGMPEKMRGAVLRAARLCFIHNTLCHSPQVDIDYAPAREE